MERMERMGKERGGGGGREKRMRFLCGKCVFRGDLGEAGSVAIGGVGGEGETETGKKT